MAATLGKATEEWLNANDLSTTYKLPIQTVWRLTREGRLPGKKITRKVTIYRASEVEAALGLNGDAPAPGQTAAH